jgi:hypothetical protein
MDHGRVRLENLTGKQNPAEAGAQKICVWRMPLNVPSKCMSVVACAVGAGRLISARPLALTALFPHRFVFLQTSPDFGRYRATATVSL